MPLSGLLDVLFPPACVACGRVLPGQAFFCEGCDRQLERTPPTRCGGCAEPGIFPGARCPRCKARPPPFSCAFAPFAHQGPIARAIHELKYEDHPELAPALAALLCVESGEFLEQAPDQVCAIPLHEKRFRARRYDQALLLAGELARLTRRRFVPQALVRVKETQRQVGLSDHDREQNVAGAFRAAAEVAGQRMLVLDDVFTTGATARAAALALRAAGAGEVRVITLARANLLA